MEKAISGIPGIESWHHLHVWAVSTTENAATLHAVIKDLSQLEEIKHAIKHALREKGIQHSTVEIELSGCDCGDRHCD